MENSRIKNTDSMPIVISKMAGNNFGAMDVVIKILQDKIIDPDNLLEGVGTIIMLDNFGIYGTDIYVLYNDICERNLVKMIAVLRSVQLGIFDRTILKDACHRQDRSGKDMVPVEDLYLKVKQRLPNFDAEGKGHTEKDESAL